MKYNALRNQAEKDKAASGTHAEQLKKLQAERDQLNDRVKVLSQNLERDKAEWSKKYESLRVASESSSSEWKIKFAQVEKSNNQAANEWKDKYHKLSEQSKQDKKNWDQRWSNYQQLEKERNDLNNKFKSLQDKWESDTNRMKSELAQLKESSKRSIAKADFDALQGRYNDSDKRARELQAILVKLEQNHKKLGVDYDELKAELAQLRKQAAKPLAAPIAKPVIAPKSDVEKENEALARVKAKASKIDFAHIGKADANKKDDLKKIKGVGPFLEKKCNALGIYTYKQIANFRRKDIDMVNDAIEFFPGRILRDDWVGQCKGFLKPKSTKDDLKKVEGIGPKIEQLLNKGGIHTWDQLSQAKIGRLQEILNSGGPRYQMHDPSTWPKQAQMAHEGKWEALKKWQDELDGGKA